MHDNVTEARLRSAAKQPATASRQQRRMKPAAVARRERSALRARAVSALAARERVLGQHFDERLIPRTFDPS